MSTYERLSELSVVIDSHTYEPLEWAVNPDFTRLTTVVRLQGSGYEGVGEDVTYEALDHIALQDSHKALDLAGTYTLDGFCKLLDELDLFATSPPVREVSRYYRRWAFESAALDLALSQAGLSLAQALGIEPSPMRFVVSLRLGEPPSIERLRGWLALYPDTRFKLDATSSWDDELIAQLAATEAVDSIDLKGFYTGTPVEQAADPELYARVVRGLGSVWIEDPALTAQTLAALAGHHHYITWDAPIHSVRNITELAFKPRMINIKPSRFGSLAELFAAYDHCANQGIGAYGGGQFELGPGRGQNQYLASLFHPDGPNDLAPTAYNSAEPVEGLEQSPLSPQPAAAGFRFGQWARATHP